MQTPQKRKKTFTFAHRKKSPALSHSGPKVALMAKNGNRKHPHADETKHPPANPPRCTDPRSADPMRHHHRRQIPAAPIGIHHRLPRQSKSLRRRLCSPATGIHLRQRARTVIRPTVGSLRHGLCGQATAREHQCRSPPSAHPPPPRPCRKGALSQPAGRHVCTSTAQPQPKQI